MKDIFDYIKEIVGISQPFELQDLEKGDFSYENLRQQLSRMVKQKKIVRFSQGMYFIPKETNFGLSSVDPFQVIQKKFLGDMNSIKGFPVGLSFENAIGLTQQVPATLEIVTNSEKSKKRTLRIGYRQVIVRKPLAAIDSTNFKYLQLLEYLRLRNIGHFENKKTEVLKKYVSKEKLSRKVMFHYLIQYPASVSKRLVESGIIDVLI